MANNDVGEGAVLDQIVRVLKSRDNGEQRRIIVALADRFGVELSGGRGRDEDLGRDDFGHKIRRGDEMITGTSSLGTPLNVSLGGIDRSQDD